MTRTVRATFLIAAMTVVALVTAACGRTPLWNDNPTPGPSGTPPSISISNPRDGTQDAPASSEIVFTAAGATEVAVGLVDVEGRTVEGVMRPDGSGWLPASPLAYSMKYTATVTATGSDGLKTTATSTFTTMPTPANLVNVHSWIGDDQVVGVAMPLVLTFDRAIPADLRDDVERRLFVRSEPPQEGIWHWFSGTEVHYRPRAMWQTGTKLDLRVGTGGLPLGPGGWYGQHDLTVRATVGAKVQMDVDNRTKTLTVTRDGKVLRRIPVSLGKPSSPSSSGNLMVMEKKAVDWFDSSTYGVPVNSPDGYRTKVNWTMRLTWSGEFLHGAPWSVADQGRRNVSHGCVNISDPAAKWLFGIVKVGDPITVRNTERRVKWGDGWTDWDRPWTEYVKGSAL